MANLPSVSGRNTLIDIAKSFGPDGNVQMLAELLNQSNEILNDMTFMEGNLPTGHKAMVRASLPNVTLRKYYQGVPVSKSGRDTIEDTIAQFEGRNEIDKDLADLNGNAAAFRYSEATAFVESITQTVAQNLVYGDTSVTKEGILGFTPRYNSLSGNAGKQVISAGGSGSDNTSVWLVVWSDQTVTGIYPKGSKAGLTQEDLGVIDAFDASNNRFRAYAERWQWKLGLHIKDYRYVVRIANIDVSDLKGITATQATTASTYLPYLMAQALQKVPSAGVGNAVFYANRTVKEMLSVLGMNKASSFMTFSEATNQFGTVAPGSVAGSGTGIRGGQIKFLGVPVRTVDQILLTESVVS